MALLEINNVSRLFGGVKAVNNVSLTLSQGEIVGLIGPNGAGKTTLFNLVSGVLKPDAGSILFDGRDITPLTSDAICRCGIARTFQLVRPFNRLTPLENVMVGRLFGCVSTKSMKQARLESEEILSLMGLSEKRVKMAGALGLVDRKRLEIALAKSRGIC